MRKRIVLWLSLMMIFSLIAGCQTKETLQTQTDKDSLTIVTTIFPQYDFSKQITGDLADVHMLLKPGAESHTYEPTPQDIKLIENSDLFIYIGGENDAWVDDILASFGNQAPKAIKLLDMVDVLDEELVEGMEDSHKHDHEEASTDAYHHEHTIDEHVWTSPVNAIKIVEKISSELQTLDAKNADQFQTNTSRYIDELSKLDKEFREFIDNANRDTILFGDRFPFRYFTEEYGLDYYAAFTGCSTDTEASAATVAFLIDKTKELELNYVFSIEFSNEKIVDSIAEATGAAKLTLHSIHNVSVEDLELGENYLSLMERNLQNLEKALQ